METALRGLVAAALVVILCSPVRAADKKANTPEAQLEAAVNAMNAAWMAGDVAAFKKMLAPKLMGAWDLDMASRPIAFTSPDAVTAFMAKSHDEMVKMGAKFEMKNDKLECKASGSLGFCVLEMTGTMTMPGMPTIVMKGRSTEVFEKGKQGWLAIHHHGSMAQAAEMPAKSAAFDYNKVTWQDVPDMPGAKSAMIWMNPLTGAMATLMKVGPDGMKQPRHIHPYSATITVLEGSFKTSDWEGKLAEYKPGMVVYRAPNEPHETMAKAGTVILLVTDGPMMTIEMPAETPTK